MSKFYIEIKDSDIGETTVKILSDPSEFDKPSNARNVTLKILKFIDDNFTMKNEPAIGVIPIGKIIKA